MVRKMTLRLASALVAGAVVAALALGAAKAEVMLSFDPTAQSVEVGDSLMVDVRVSGLTAGSSPTLGAFDVDVLFDPLILDFQTLAFGTGLNGGDPSASVDGFAESPPGVLDAFEVSLLSTPLLDAAQPDSFVLATLSFEALASGSSALSFGPTDLSDAFGNALMFQTASGSVSVLPAPASALLLGFGLAGLGAAVRRKRGHTVSA